MQTPLYILYVASFVSVCEDGVHPLARKKGYRMILRSYSKIRVNYLAAHLLAQHVFFASESDAEWASAALDTLCDAELVSQELRMDALHTWQEIRDRRLAFLQSRRRGAARSSSRGPVKSAALPRDLTGQGKA